MPTFTNNTKPGSEHAIVGVAGDGIGVHGTSDTSTGTGGVSTGGIGVHGVSRDGPGVRGDATKGVGVFGASKESTGVGGMVDSGIGVHGVSKTGVGVRGDCDTFQGVYGHSTGNAGVVGESENMHGVFGVCHNPNGGGVFGTSKDGFGVIGESESGVGIFGHGGRLAGLFDGDVRVAGDLNVGGQSVGALLQRIAYLEDQLKNVMRRLESQQPAVHRIAGGNIGAFQFLDRGRFRVIGTSGFTPNSPIVIRIATFFRWIGDFDAASDNDGRFSQIIILGDVSGPLFCAATDRRHNDCDLTGFLWSNTMRIG